MMKKFEEAMSRLVIEFSTREYERSHGRMPRGVGMWGFRFGEHEFWSTPATLTEAKKQCRAEVKRVAGKDCYGIVMVRILP